MLWHEYYPLPLNVVAQVNLQIPVLNFQQLGKLNIGSQELNDAFFA